MANTISDSESEGFNLIIREFHFQQTDGYGNLIEMESYEKDLIEDIIHETIEPMYKETGMNAAPEPQLPFKIYPEARDNRKWYWFEFVIIDGKAEEENWSTGKMLDVFEEAMEDKGYELRLIEDSVAIFEKQPKDNHNYFEFQVVKPPKTVPENS